jgi:AraC-like DNA-binding protein
MDLSASENIVILQSRGLLELPEGVHQHDSYEFTLNLSHSFLSRVGKRNMPLRKNHLMAINPGQNHGTTRPLAGVHLMALHMDRKFLQQVARQMYGSEEVYFDNRELLPDSHIRGLVNLFMEESRSRQAGYDFILQSLDTQIAVGLLRTAGKNLPSGSPKYGEKENINRSIEFIMANFNRNFSLNEVSAVANLSPYHFIRVFKAQTGKTPYEYLMELKIEKARELLQAGKMTVTEVCYQCGFSNRSHFTAVFKGRVGLTPTSYRHTVSK